ncbi:DUF5615 family PIN-like protein [Microcoleus sp. bin38.metabat.b11b12b14.051]|uniref:DUF5615 family PIN-like protein n=1 Tax=Microcoleus sp. bin38.metabat.b11b12b14.051 TaxID=2742709 RepID=UPI0025F3B387|nr:DUF5615 family PIN-like protein [Microcoleus sp. bin38.metabat.b11b12b14.051]
MLGVITIAIANKSIALLFLIKPMIERVRLYSNENFPIAMVEHLRSLDCDVLTSYDADRANQGIPDDEVLRFATAQNRTVITFNRDDFVALHRGGEHHAGIIICKDDRDYLGQVTILYTYLQEVDSLDDRLIRIKKQNQRGFSYPVFVVQEYAR